MILLLTFLAANDIGALIKLDQSSLLRNKIRFARACVRVNIQGPLLEFAEVCRVGDLVHGYVIWYKDFSSGCSFCGEISHEIDACPLLTSPKKEILVQLLENPKQKDFFLTMAKASSQAIHEITAEQAKVVHVQSKHFKRNDASPKVPVVSSIKSKNSAGILPTPRNVGLVIKEPVYGSHGSAGSELPLPPIYRKGKGKLVMANPVVSDDSSDDEATILEPLVPLHLPKPTGLEMEYASESLSPLCSPPSLGVFCPSDLVSDSQLQAHQIFPDQGLEMVGTDKEDDTTFLVDPEDSESFGELNSLAGNSFHSLHSDSSLVKQIEHLGMDPALPIILYSQSGSIRRRVDDMEIDDASSALKRKRN